VIKKRGIAVLRPYTPQPQNFSEGEFGFLEALAEMGALAIENARMDEQIRKDYEILMGDILGFVGCRRSIGPDFPLGGPSKNRISSLKSVFLSALRGRGFSSSP
jgi:hypothetical protein